MGSPLISPKFLFPCATPGALAAGFKLNTYIAGTSTPWPTYTSASLAVANANPVIMDANGLADVWLDNSSYKFVGTDASNNVLWTVDNVTQAYLGQSLSEWVSFGLPVTFISGTSFSLPAIVNATQPPYNIGIGTRIRTTNTGGTIYSTVLTVSANVITLRNDSGNLDAGLSAAYYGIITSANNSSLARRSLVAILGVLGANTNLVNGVATQVNMTGLTTVADVLSEFTVLFQPKVGGTYRVSGIVAMTEQAATTGIANVAQTVGPRKNGTYIDTQQFNWPFANSLLAALLIPFDVSITLAPGDSVDIAATGAFTGTAPTATVRSFNVVRLT